CGASSWWRPCARPHGDAREDREDTVPDSGPANVLVVDDTPAKRYVMSSWLRRAGHHVVEAAGGEEALTVIGAYHPDLVILDVRLPDLSGFEVCERIKADPGTAAIPVIQVS